MNLLTRYCRNLDKVRKSQEMGLYFLRAGEYIIPVCFEDGQISYHYTISRDDKDWVVTDSEDEFRGSAKTLKEAEALAWDEIDFFLECQEEIDKAEAAKENVTEIKIKMKQIAVIHSSISNARLGSVFINSVYGEIVFEFVLALETEPAVSVSSWDSLMKLLELRYKGFIIRL